MVSEKTYQRLIMQTHDDAGCRIWEGYTAERQYPLFVYYEQGKKHTLSARRVVYEHEVRKIPSSWRIVMTCESPLCLNPEHMKVYDRKKYAVWANGHISKKKRADAARRQSHFEVKINQQIADEIRLSDKSAKELAAEYNISERTIFDVRNYVTWRNTGIFSGLIR